MSVLFVKNLLMVIHQLHVLERKDVLVYTRQTSTICPVELKPGDTVHIQCWKYFTRPKSKILTTNNVSHKRILRSEQFDFKSKCLLCGSFAKFSLNTKKKSHDVYLVRNLDFQEKILNHSVERNDNWANEVHSRSAWPSSSSLFSL